MSFIIFSTRKKFVPCVSKAFISRNRDGLEGKGHHISTRPLLVSIRGRLKEVYILVIFSPILTFNTLSNRRIKIKISKIEHSSRFHLSYFCVAQRLEMLVKTSGMCLFGVRSSLVFFNSLVTFLLQYFWTSRGAETGHVKSRKNLYFRNFSFNSSFRQGIKRQNR